MLAPAAAAGELGAARLTRRALLTGNCSAQEWLLPARGPAGNLRVERIGARPQVVGAPRPRDARGLH